MVHGSEAGGEGDVGEAGAAGDRVAVNVGDEGGGGWFSLRTCFAHGGDAGGEGYGGEVGAAL
jgi:hypothetical protein